ncbi:alginate export family protein [Geotalea sp. SG265]|uniref:alginate export family protein n=1 Tax=Geotalea sp. SG265 TaxID=2922867 RepID=UPI001FAEE955|nr:alginate export family protein [Geotalea sp. SG265]
MSNCLIAIAMCGIALLCGTMAEGRETGPSAPPYELNRADEDYQYLRAPSRRTDFWDPVKYLPLNGDGSWYLSIGGEARERYEYFKNDKWGEGAQDPNGYFLQRYFLHGDLHFGDNVRLFSQLQSSLENGRRGGPRSTDEDELDLHQGFLDLKMGLDDSGALTLRSGRQELAYGSQRIISVREGPNVRQAFDGFRVMYRTDALSIDGIATEPAETRRHVFDDGPDNNQALWGIYSVFPLPFLPGGNADFYYLGLYRRQARFDKGVGREARHSVGTRLWRTKKPLDYNFEFLYQWGSFGSGDIRAWTAASDTGYTTHSLPLSPRFGLRADIASGDEDPESTDLQTFNPLFPKGAYFSENGLIGPANFINVNPSVQLHFDKEVTATVNWDFFWRESMHDGIYNNAVTLVRSGKNSHARYIGSQPQAQLEWNLDRHMTLVVIYAHFLAGPFLRESGPGKDVDYVTTWITYKF